jgi:uncharacterized protein (TIRG00374 family)
MGKQKIAKKIATWAIMLIVLIILAVKVDWRGTFAVIRKGNIYFIGLAVLVTMARFFIWGFKWRNTLSPLVRISLSKIFPILMTGVFLNQITPGRDTGGEPIRAYYISKYTGLKKREALATIIIDKSGNYTAIGTFILFSIFFITFFINVPPSVKVILEGVLLIIFLAIISAVYVKKNLSLPGIPVGILKKIYFFKPLKIIRKQFSTYAAFEEYVLERFTDFVTTFRDLLKEKRNVRDNLLLSFLIWSMVFVKTYLIFLSFGQNVNILMVTAVEAISILLGIISFLPGGVGATEVTMIALFSSAGISVEIATAVTIVSRGIFYAFSLGLGYLSFLYLKVMPNG